MNIFEMYNTYREQHVAEFKEILQNVGKELLLMTEQLPEDIVLENFRKNEDRRYLVCNGTSRKPGEIQEGCLAVSISAEFMGQFHWNDDAAQKMDKFMEEYYPGIICCRNYVLDLYTMSIGFRFYFQVEYSDSDFALQADSGILKNDRLSISTSMELFNYDIGEVLQRDFSSEDWEELFQYTKEDKQRTTKSNGYKWGSIMVKVPIQ